jgi:hypothetical protein
MGVTILSDSAEPSVLERSEPLTPDVLIPTSPASESEQTPPVPDAAQSATTSEQPQAQNWASYGDWIQLYSRSLLSEVVSLGEIYKKQLSNVAVFRYANGWYVLVLGPFTAGTAAPIRDHLIRISAIPSDSVVTPGDGFVNLMWGDHPKPAPASSQEQASQRTVKAVREFFQTSTLSNKTALHFLDRLYPPETTYFGKRVSKEYAMEQKRLFLERWPERMYTLQPATLSTTCNKTDNSCTVTGIVDWRASSKKRKTSAEGTSRFQLPSGASFFPSGVRS